MYWWNSDYSCPSWSWILHINFISVHMHGWKCKNLGWRKLEQAMVYDRYILRSQESVVYRMVVTWHCMVTSHMGRVTWHWPCNTSRSCDTTTQSRNWTALQIAIIICNYCKLGGGGGAGGVATQGYQASPQALQKFTNWLALVTWLQLMLRSLTKHCLKAGWRPALGMRVTLSEAHSACPSHLPFATIWQGETSHAPTDNSRSC